MLLDVLFFLFHGVYDVEDDYKIGGLLIFRGKEIPQEMKNNDLYEYITLTKLDYNKEEDKNFFMIIGLN